jgi:PAS domain S-box-containing protein
LTEPRTKEEATEGGSLRALLIDDNPDDRALVARELAREFPGIAILQITGEPPFQDALESAEFTLVITDYQLRWSDGLTVLRAIKSRVPECPVVMFTGTGTEEVAVEAMKAGLDDYIIKKPTHFARLSLSVKRVLERVAERRALQAAETRYLRLFEGAPVGLYRAAPDGKLLDVNAALVQMLRFPDRLSLMRTGLSNLWVTPEARTTLLQALEREGVARDFEAELRCRDGEDIWARMNIQAFRDAAGRVVFWEAAVEDVTARRRIEKELRDRASQHAVVAELGQQALAEDDVPALIRRAVEVVARTLGVELCKVLELLPEEKAFLLKAGVGWRAGEVGTARVSAGTDSQAGFTLLNREPVIVDDLPQERRFSGPLLLREHGVVSGMSVIIPGRERPYGVLGAHATSRRAFTRDDCHFLQSVANLLAAAIQRQETQQALHEAEAKFLQAQKMEAIGRLAGGVAHDFNNLLTAITGFAELALAHLGEQDPVRRDLEEIRKAGDRAARLTKQLLAFSRRQVLQPRVLDLNTVVADLSQMLRRVIGEDIELLTVAEPSLGRVKADSGQLEQMLMNLAVNARDAMPSGGKLTIETANVELAEPYARFHAAVKPGHYVMLAVSDTGAGMDAETQAQIFEPFFTTKTERGGTGLGLATVYGIVKQSGGNIWVYSELGKGTTFKIYLPRVDLPLASSASSGSDVASVQGTETILLAEDDALVRDLIREILPRHGYNVLAAPSAREAAQIAERHDGPIDLLITDVVMPEVNGRELARQIQASRPGIRVLYMSGYTDDAIVQHGVVEPNAVLLEKPFTARALARKVRSVLNAT